MRMFFHRGLPGLFWRAACMVLLLPAVFGCSACGAANPAGTAGSAAVSKPDAAQESGEGTAVDVPYQLVQVPTGGYDSEQVLPLARAVASPGELADFYAAYREQFELDGLPGGDSFAAQMQTYDDAWFADHLLIVALFEMTNGAQSIAPASLTAQNGAYMLAVTSETGGIGTTALEYSAWFLEIGPENGVMPVEIQVTQQA